MKVMHPVREKPVKMELKTRGKRWDDPAASDATKISPAPAGEFSEPCRKNPCQTVQVLIADDDPMIQLLARQALDSRHFEIMQAENGEQALELFESCSPDLVLCDVMMPGLDGYEVCAAIRKTKAGQHVPIIMLTGLNDAESIENAFAVGATDFCEKPVNWDLLPYKLNYVLRASSTFSELQVSEERYSLVARGANDGIWDWDYKTDRVYFSPRWKSMLGFADNAVGDHPQEWLTRIHPDDKSRVVAELDAHKNAHTPHFECEYRIRNAEGGYRWMMCRGLAVSDEYGVAYRMTGSQTDITERKQAEEKLAFDAVHDALTGLPNRVLFLDRLEHCIELSARRQNFSFAVLYLDLNRFKLVNDSLGHILGDQMLVEVAYRIQHAVRKGDTVARLGGDEFAVLCEDIDDITVATSLADRIQKHMLKPVDLEGQLVVIGCSIGITESSIGYDSPVDMLRDADVAMYRAKLRNATRYEIFDVTMHEKAMNVLQLESDLRQGLETGEFELYYQPIVEIDAEAVSGFEALLRWHHPKLGLLVPEEFLDVAIDSRVIVPLGRWVLAEACRQMQSWKQDWDEARDWTISVNLSAPELAQPDLIDAVNEIIESSRLDPGYLKLEITETSLIKNSGHAMQTMNRLRERGIKLSIDDFGTGYSSFNYLHQFPFDELKIDRTFISELDDREDKQQIVNAIVSLAHNLGMTVVAEGSASEAIYENLRGASCEYAQGFSIMEPKSASEITQSIALDVDRTDITGFETG